MIEALRTPDDRFVGLAGYPFEPHYVESLPGYEGLRLHYLDEGPADATETFLCLHGQPTWSYLYRSMIPILSAAGHRVIAPDLFGFGRSDKPVDDAVYTFDFHRGALLAFIEALDLRGVTLVVHDWGGILGLILPHEAPERYRRLVIHNTALATGDVPLTEGFYAWRQWSSERPDLDVGKLMGRSTPRLTPEECAAYGAPFPDQRFKGGVRRFPNLVPDAPDAPGAAISRRAREFWRDGWDGESFMIVGMADPVLGPDVMKMMRRLIRGCPEPFEIAEAGHFVPEYGDVIAPRVLAAFGL